jgi:hypothetical protein
VVTLRGDDPTLELKIDKGGRPTSTSACWRCAAASATCPGTSFFSWGWREPVEWARAFWYEGREYQAPTAMVDLSKPAFKLGVAALKVGLAAHELQVEVTARQAAVPGARQGAGAPQGHAGRAAGCRRRRRALPRSTKACWRCATTTSWDCWAP